ncbi:MAG: FkbM family methyltransferase [Saprospiraceae bacterium]|nr:FkbM family methyltransferase [Saprospiraceae bacterium]
MQICNIDGIKYRITNPNDIIQRQLIQGVQWDRNLYQLIYELIKEFNCQSLLNVGCHIGTLCLPISRYIKQVTAIEAFPPTYELLLENIQLNQIKNIQTFNFALGNESDVIYFMDQQTERVSNNTGGMHVFTKTDILENRKSSHLVSMQLTGDMKRLDDLKEIEPFDILLIDVEGSENALLEGARNTIEKNRPILIIEIWDDQKRIEENMAESRFDVIEKILDMGYTLRRQQGDDFIFIPT